MSRITKLFDTIPTSTRYCLDVSTGHKTTVAAYSEMTTAALCMAGECDVWPMTPPDVNQNGDSAQLSMIGRRLARLGWSIVVIVVGVGAVRPPPPPRWTIARLLQADSANITLPDNIANQRQQRSTLIVINFYSPHAY